MTQPFKLAILRAVHDGGTMQATDFIDFVMTDPKSVLGIGPTSPTGGWTDSSAMIWRLVGDLVSRTRLTDPRQTPPPRLLGRACNIERARAHPLSGWLPVGPGVTTLDR